MAIKHWYRLLWLVLLTQAGSVSAEDSSGSDDNVVNYAYAVVFGTGVYKVKDQKAFLIRLPFSHRVHEPDPPTPGLRILMPALVGYYDYDYDSLLGGDLPGDAAVTSFVPGLELTYEVNDRWQLRPFAQAGFGRDLQNKENAFIYAAGVSSRYRFPSGGFQQLTLGNNLISAGYDPDGDGSQSMLITGAGLDYAFPWRFSVFGKRSYLASYAAYYLYLDNPSFEQGQDRAQKVNNEVEWSLALGFETPPSLLGITLERIGLGFRYGGDIRGVRIVTDFPF